LVRTGQQVCSEEMFCVRTSLFYPSNPHIGWHCYITSEKFVQFLCELVVSLHLQTICSTLNLHLWIAPTHKSTPRPS
jgi:hypothetical protein